MALQQPEQTGVDRGGKESQTSDTRTTNLKCSHYQLEVVVVVVGAGGGREGGGGEDGLSGWEEGGDGGRKNGEDGKD